jgi:transposase-like protein
MAAKRIHQLTIKEWEAAFPTEDHCADYLVRHRWPTGTIRCPRCGAEVTHSVSTMPYRWQCYTCTPNSGYRFSHIAGTIFENTNKPLRDWFRVIHMMLTSKKGVSALQIHRTMGFGSYKTAWYMCHRVRAGLQNEEFRKLIGVVEVDETYIGGSDSNKHEPRQTASPEVQGYHHWCRQRDRATFARRATTVPSGRWTNNSSTSPSGPRWNSTRMPSSSSMTKVRLW